MVDKTNSGRTCLTSPRFVSSLRRGFDKNSVWPAETPRVLRITASGPRMKMDITSVQKNAGINQGETIALTQVKPQMKIIGRANRKSPLSSWATPIASFFIRSYLQNGSQRNSALKDVPGPDRTFKVSLASTLMGIRWGP